MHLSHASRFADSVTIFLSIWLFANVALSNGSAAPELPLTEQARTSPEYSVLRQLQDLMLELQLFDITIRNRRDAQFEEQLVDAVEGIKAEGARVAATVRAAREQQLEGLFGLFFLGRQHGTALGVAPIEWDELFNAIKEGQIKSGPVSVHTPKGTLTLFSLSSMAIGRAHVWRITMPTFDRKSFWVQARVKGTPGRRSIPELTNAALDRRFDTFNAPYSGAEKLARNYFSASYSRLYSAFEDQRYAFLQRVALARRALGQLARTNGAMGTPEQYATLYNQVLENLFSYGIDVSLPGEESPTRDLAIKGFLFSDSPERSRALVEKLKFHPGEAPSAYNSPSS